ncbi:MAG: hypothetical protein AB7W47_07780 [Calditrichaceae bacterium]
MKSSTGYFNYLFRSTKGLVLVAISVVSLITAIWGTLSGPMVEWGVRDLTVKLLGMDMHHWDREGRIIMLYHTIAMAVLAIEVYFITSIVPMKKHQQVNINATITVGYLTATIFGLWFAYFGHAYIFHGLFLVGQSLVFFAGVLLAAALWPWNKEYYLAADSDYAHTKSGMDLERAAFFTMAVMTLLSATWGAVTGSYWSNGHETFLAENLIRNPHKTALEHAIIGHLHIMLSLVAVAITLVVGRWLDFKGMLHRWAMYLMIPGTIILTLGALSIVWLPWAHNTIYVGSVGVMLAALLYVIYSWKKLINDRVAELGLSNPTVFQKVKALLHDPLKFGTGWQMVFMNFTVSGVGIFMAVKLDKIFRVWPAREERITLTGHWHILAAIIATIILMYYVDMSGVKGKIRQWFGWILIIGSDIAFASATIFSMKRLFVTEYAKQPLVNMTMLLMDFGLGAILIILAILMGWRLFDLFKQDGLWKKEAINPEVDIQRIFPAAPVKDLNVEQEVN